MITLYPLQGIAFNRDKITCSEVIDRSDRYNEPHVIVRFVGGDFVEFPPGMTISDVFPVP